MQVLSVLARVLGLKASTPTRHGLKPLSGNELNLVTGGGGTPPPPSSPHPRWLF